MVLIDSSAWIEYFRNGKMRVVESVATALQKETVIIGDLILFEVLQGIRSKSEKELVSELFGALERFPLGGFQIAEKAADNFRTLRSKGITVRKSIDMIIGTFCIEHHIRLLHNDRDFDVMERYLNLRTYN
ncbi:MAG: PIN domain nuclease [Fibrobacteres bacterium]|nr:PIN domain nuclease [Fibrobacterota bacterium]